MTLGTSDTGVQDFSRGGDIRTVDTTTVHDHWAGRTQIVVGANAMSADADLAQWDPTSSSRS